jgi:hypothetical protein
MRKIETLYLKQIWTSGSCSQKGHIVWADKQEFSTHLDLLFLKVTKNIRVHASCEHRSKWNEPWKSVRENKTFNSNITSVGTQNLKEVSIHVS